MIEPVEPPKSILETTSGTLKCEPCSIGKAKQRNVSKTTVSADVGAKDKLFMNLDVSTTKAPKEANANYQNQIGHCQQTDARNIR